MEITRLRHVDGAGRGGPQRVVESAAHRAAAGCHYRIMTATDDDETQTHRVTATEPVWVGATHEYDAEADKIQHGERSIGDAIDFLMDDAAYDCSCGESFTSWRAAEEHLRDEASE